MKKVILLSDIHITDVDEFIIGLDPLARFMAVLQHALCEHADADHLVLMGDLAHHGRVNEYMRLKSALAHVTIPITLMLGNHDRRAAFHSVFGDTPQEFCQGTLHFGDTTLIYLDSLDEEAPDIHSGFLCCERLNWLETTLEDVTGPAVVLVHHHLFPSGFDGMDAIKLRNGLQVNQVLAESGKCQLLINGHIHRTIFGTFHGVPHAMIKSPCHQMPMKLGPGKSSLSVAEPGGYGVLLITDHGPILHHVDVGLPTTEISNDDAS